MLHRVQLVCCDTDFLISSFSFLLNKFMFENLFLYVTDALMAELNYIYLRGIQISANTKHIDLFKKN